MCNRGQVTGRAIVLGWLILLGATVMVAAAGLFSGRQTDWSDVFPQRLDQLDLPRSFPETTDDDAKAYYRRVSQQLNLPVGEKPFADLDSLLTYFGHNNLSAWEVDVLPPEELRKRVIGGDVLVARYFSPKTSDVSGRSNNLSWRKVVRLKPQANSPAEKAGLAAMHFLSVAYTNDRPFPEGRSTTINVQVILSRKPGWESGQDPAYWLVFDPDGGKYSLGFSTTTSWDAADPALLDGQRKYHPDRTCRMCHGGRHDLALLHFLDTDWYLDKVQPGDDFGPVFANSKWGPLYDCGSDPQSPTYASGFDVFRKLNEEILEQNTAVLAEAEKQDPMHTKWVTRQVARQTKAAAKWVELHAKSDRYFPPLERALGDPQSQQVWNQNDLIDCQLLPLLSRYCYRCHSTLKYNVFDKHELVRKDRQRGEMIVTRMIARLQETEIKSRMPQDRDMEKRHNPDWRKLLELLQKLEAKYK